MTVPTWPVTLPQTLDVQGYSHQSADTVLRTSMDAGPAKTRRRFSAGVEPVAGTILVTAAQLTTLRTFYDATLLGGSVRFNWVDPPTNAAAELRFTSSPRWTAVGIYYRVALELEILP